MKIQILAGTLAIVLLLAIVPIPPAEAKMFLIDDFSDDNAGMTCDLTKFDNTGILGAVQTGLSNVIDMVRECTIFLTAFDGQSNVGILVVQSTGMFRHMAGTNMESRVMLIYNANGAGLGIDTTTSDDFKIGYSKSDFPVDVTIRFTDSGGDWGEQTSQLAGNTVAPTQLQVVRNIS